MTKKIRMYLSYIIFFIGIFILGGTCSYLYKYYSDIHKSKKTFDEVKTLIDEDDKEATYIINMGKKIKVSKRDYTKLYEQNNDFIGWIKINGTNIDYPVMLTPNNEEYYLHTNFNKQYDFSGVPFCNKEADLITPSDNITIYGHHMMSGTMFAQLDKFKQKDFYDEHPTFTFDTIYRWGIYEVVGVYLTDVNEGSYKYWEVTDCTENEFNDYVQFIKNKSLYETNGIDNVKYGDKLVSLSTCAYHVTNGRLVVVGKLIYNEPTKLYNSLNLNKNN